MRAHDWTKTPLGPPETWPQSLKTAVGIMLTSRQPIWIGWGVDLTYLYNDAYKSIIGGKHPWALGRPTSEVWSEIWSDIGPRLETAMQGVEGTYDEQQLLIMERYGYPEETYYTFSYSPIPDDDGSPNGIICANTDDTRRVIGERQIALLRELGGANAARSCKEACERSAAAFATDSRDLPFAGIYILDHETDELALEAQHGIAPGHPAAPERLSLQDWPAAMQALASVEPVVVSGLRERYSDLPTGAWPEPPREAAVMAIPAAGEDGRAGILWVGLNPYRVFDDGYRGFLGLVCGQISGALAHAEGYQAERRRAQALADIDRAKTAFFSNVSHEFRTPLTLMLGPLEEALGHPMATPAIRIQVDVARRNGLRLLKLVNSLLDFSRIEAGRTEAQFRSVNLGQIVIDLTSTFRSATDRAGLTLEASADPEIGYVQVDPGMIEKILLNLLSNAFKFTLEGSIAVSVTRGADPATVEIAVADTGVGIPPDAIPRLFERFHRVQGTRGRSFEGSGIGLALVHELVQLQGGRIEVESVVDRGSTFRVVLPLRAGTPASGVTDSGADAPIPLASARAYVEEALRWLPDTQPHAEASNSLSPNGGTGARVLVADDNADMRDYVARLLSGAGMQVATAADGEAALQAIRGERPDLVLTDVMMPRLDGFGLLRAIRGDPNLADLPVIMLSARAGEDAAVEGLDAGADDYLSKPFASRELLARVGVNLALSRVRREAAQAMAARNAELEALLDTAPVCIFFTDDVEARSVKSNRFATQLLRMGSPYDNPSADALGGRADFDLRRDGEPVSAGEAPLERAARGEEVVGEEVEVRFQDGSSVDLLMNATPIRNEVGEPRGAVAVAIDITQRRRAETEREAAYREVRVLNATLERRIAEALAERKVLADIVEGTDALVQVSDPEYRWLGFNRAAADEYERIFGVRPRIGQSMLDALVAHPELEREVKAVWARALAGEEFTTVSEFGDPDRDRRHYEMKFNVLRDADDRQVGAFQFVYDVTARIREQERLAQAEEQLRNAQKMEAMGQLTGGVAHDFNNLLTPIIGALDMLQRNRVGTDRQQRLIDGALMSADRAKILVQRLLAFARRQPLQPIAVDVGALVKGMADLVSSTTGPQIHVSVDVASNLAPALADPNQLEMALLNLSVNARDAMPNGGTIRISVTNETVQGAPGSDLAAGAYVRLSVADTGSGMDASTLSRAIEPFFSTKGLGKGTGLGLSMAHGLAQQLGGALRIRSRLGLGTNVEIWLPQSESPIAPTDSLAASEPALDRRGSVLLVDDDDVVRASIAEMLAELGYEVTEADSAEEAVRRFNAGLSVDMVVTDHLMPGMTGVDLARTVQARSPGMPVLIISGYAELEGIDPGLPRLTKPFVNAELARALAALS